MRGTKAEIERARKAFLVEQAKCIQAKGEECYAYGGAGCKSCPKRKEGIRRRLAAFREEKKQTVMEKISWAGEAVRERKVDNHICVEFGYRPSDAKTIFIVKRAIVMTPRERKTLREIWCGK